MDSEAEGMMAAEIENRGGSHGKGGTEVEISSEGRPRAMLPRDQRRASEFTVSGSGQIIVVGEVEGVGALRSYRMRRGPY